MHHTSDDRVRGRKLQRLRAELFQREPLCRRCAARSIVRIATQRDHIVALTNGGKDTEDNVQPLCDECHEAKTREDLGQRGKQTIGTDGWPA